MLKVNIAYYYSMYISVIMVSQVPGYQTKMMNTSNVYSLMMTHDKCGHKVTK